MFKTKFSRVPGGLLSFLSAVAFVLAELLAQILLALLGCSQLVLRGRELMLQDIDLGNQIAVVFDRLRRTRGIVCCLGRRLCARGAPFTRITAGTML